MQGMTGSLPITEPVESLDIMRPPGHMITGLQKMTAECLCDNAVILEIGAFSGESTLIFLCSGKISRMYVVDAWQNGLDQDDLATTRYDLGEVERRFDERMLPFGQGLVIKIKGISTDVADRFLDGSLDLVYHDACHSYEPLKEELLLYRAKVRPGGVVAGHDYSDMYPGVAKAVHEVYGAPDRVFEDFSWVKFV